MAGADSSETERCRAETSDGDRCQRPARENGFCFQHGPDDGTVEEADGDADASEGDGSADEGSATEVSADGGDGDGGSVGIVEVRRTVEGDVPELIGHPFDGVIEIQREDDGWYAVVEVVERSAVPDTQDIIGRYAIELDEDAWIESYRLIERFKRGDVSNSLE